MAVLTHLESPGGEGAGLCCWCAEPWPCRTSLEETLWEVRAVLEDFGLPPGADNAYMIGFLKGITTGADRLLREARR